MAEITHRFITTNGIKMHIAECGSGPLVLLLHGFPELWYTWRHQLPALAAAGFHAVAPDQRGYGQTEQPELIEEYNVFNLVGDVVQLVYALGEKQAALVGHDYGSVVTMHCGLFRPNMFHKLVLHSIPYLQRMGGNIPPTELMKMAYGEEEFYQVMFQQPGRVEGHFAELGAYKFMRGALFTNSGDCPPDKRWKFTYKKGEKFTDHVTIPDKLPAWLTEADVDYFSAEYAKAGIRGGLNWYRNIDFNWKMTPYLERAKLMQPTLFIAGDADPAMVFLKGAYNALEKNVPNLKNKVVFPNVGHWVNQERAAECKKLIIALLKPP